MLGIKPSDGPRRRPGIDEVKYREEVPGIRVDSGRRGTLVSPGFWLTGIAFLAAYLGAERHDRALSVQALGITLWSPDDGLTVLLLMEGVKFFPFVLAGAVLADLLDLPRSS